MATTLSTTLAEILPTFIEKAKYRTDGMTVFRNFVDVLTLGPGSGNVLNEPVFGRITAYPASEGVDIGQAQALSDEESTYTPTEHAVQVVLTNRADFVQQENLMQWSNRIMSAAMATRKDTQITSQFASWSVDQGTAGNALATSFIFQAKATVLANDNATYGEAVEEGGNFFFAVHPLSLFDVEDDLFNFSSNAFQGETPLASGTTDYFKQGLVQAASNGRISQTIAGLPIIQSTNIVPDSGDDASNCVYAKNGAVLVESGGMLSHNEVILQGRGVELTMSEFYVTALRANTWGNEILADAAAV